MSIETQSNSNVIFVRIPVKSPRDTHIVNNMVFKKERGWYEVDAAYKDMLQKEPLHDSNPDGEKVFQVCTTEEATRIHMLETTRTDPRGTPDRPTRPAMTNPSPTPVAAPAAKPADDVRVPGQARRNRAPGTVPMS